MRKSLLVGALYVASLAVGCASEATPQEDNPFLQNMENDSKEDSAYLNPDGVEVEVDLEGDVEGPAYKLLDAPATIGQFAMTYFRKKEIMYFESLAEDATAKDRAEWLVNGTWVAANQLPAGAVLKHWRLRGLNTVLLFAASKSPKVGDAFTAKVPVKPFSVLADAREDLRRRRRSHRPRRVRVLVPLGAGADELQDRDAGPQGHGLEDVARRPPRPSTPSTTSWSPTRSSRRVILFGQIDDGAITENETGMRNMKRYERWLTDGRLQVGHRARRQALREEVVERHHRPDRSLLAAASSRASTTTRTSRTSRRRSAEHEIVAWDGHSMLGASDFWSRPTYPSSYQIFLYGGCLGYEYYVQPILHGKGDSWAKLDVMSSVVEVSADANEFAAPALAKMVWALDHGYRASWRQIMLTVRTNVGDSTFGVSGVRDNCFTPTGSRCH